MSISSTRSFLYQVAKLLGDVGAIRNKRVVKRTERRLAGKITGRIFSKMFK